MILGMIVGAGLLLLGFVVGRINRPPRTPPELPKPMCACDHYLSMHDPETGICNDMERDGWNNEEQEWGVAPCRCLQYVGPRPLDQLYSYPSLPPA